ncbi:hypothetical protein Z957_05265 [Clostridium sp. K25]|uniref:hypothetical protein n=1 Tax=Clostridium sp. K25 TaxID=1443109 RepID=UPI0004D6DF0F|nr:hypothetical protein [Clostridium sp. K25]KEI09313.1 hypothetical protein Z957_05265 [Clostridium sp. K25]
MERDKLMNVLQQFTVASNSVSNLTVKRLLDLHGKLAVFVNKAIRSDSDIAYKGQGLISDIEQEIQSRVRRD